VDGEAFEGGSGEGHHLELGAGQFIDGFEEQLRGAKVGDHVTVTVTFPEEYGAPNLAGKEAVFEVDVREIREKTDSVIDDEFAKMLGQESLDDLKVAIRGRFEQDYAGVSRERLKRDLLDTLEKAHEFEVPPGMVEAEFDSIWKQFEEARKNKEFDDEESDKSDDELKEEYRKIARRRVQLGLLLTEVGTANNIQVSAEEVNRALTREAQKYPGHEKAFIDMYRENPEAMATLRAPIFEEKVVDFILEMAKVTERRVSAEELMRVPDADDDASATESGADNSDKKPKKKAAKKKPAAKPASKKDAEDEKGADG